MKNFHRIALLGFFVASFPLSAEIALPTPRLGPLCGEPAASMPVDMTVPNYRARPSAWIVTGDTATRIVTLSSMANYGPGNTVKFNGVGVYTQSAKCDRGTWSATGVGGTIYETWTVKTTTGAGAYDPHYDLRYTMTETAGWAFQGKSNPPLLLISFTQKGLAQNTTKTRQATADWKATVARLDAYATMGGQNHEPAFTLANQLHHTGSAVVVGKCKVLTLSGAAQRTGDLLAELYDNNGVQSLVEATLQTEWSGMSNDVILYVHSSVTKTAPGISTWLVWQKSYTAGRYVNSFTAQMGGSAGTAALNAVFKPQGIYWAAYQVLGWTQSHLGELVPSSVKQAYYNSARTISREFGDSPDGLDLELLQFSAPSVENPVPQ